MKRTRQTRRMCALAAAVAAFQFCWQADAGISYFTGSSSGMGTVEFIHIRNGASSGSGSLSSGTSVVGSSGIHGYSHSFTDGSGAKTTAAGGIGITTNSTTATFTLDSGTGVSESDPSDVWLSGSRTRVQIGTSSRPLRWDATSPSFGPTATGYFSVTLAGVIGSGGAGSFAPSLEFRKAGVAFGSITSASFSSSSLTFSSGTFSRTLTKSLAVPSGTIGTGSTFTIHGSLEFFANNEDTPSLIEPIVVDAGGAPPTARFDSEDEIAPLGGASWNDPLVWSAEQEFLPSGVPNHAGDRAFFAPPNNAPRARAVSIDAATVTLGTLDIDDVFGGSTLISSNAGTLQMQVLDSGVFPPQRAVIQQRNTRGNAIAEISAPMVLMNPLDVHINSSAGMTISGPINTSPGVPSTPITKFGPGKLTLSGSLSINGELNVQEGELALVEGAIASAGLVVAQPGATLTLSSGGAATFTAGIEALTGGTLSNNLVANGNINITTGFLGGGPITLNNPAGVLTFRGPNNNFGTVAIQSGRIVFDGQGSMNAASAFENDGAMEVVVGNGSLGIDRIGNAAFIRTRGTLLRFSGTGTETFGNTVIDGGTSRISLQSTTGLTVVSSILQRLNNGVLLVAADNLGTVGGTRLFFSIPPNLIGGGGPAGSTNISILPFASSAGTGTLNIGTSLLTYDVNGLRPLSVGTEYLNNIAGAASTSNVRVTASQNLAAPQTINALVVAGSVSISGAPTLTISSGALLTSGSGTISTPINFGSAEGVITVGTSSSRNFTGAIFGTGGVTKAGNGVAAFLSGGSGYSGPTTIVAGQLNYSGNATTSGPGPLGNNSSTITLAAGGDLATTPPSLIAVAAGTTTFSRPLQVRGNRASTFGSDFFSGRTVVMNGAVSVQRGLNVVGPTTIFNGVISGSGALIASHGVDGMLNTQRAVVELNASNTFSGGLNVDSGVFRLGHDNAAGTGPIRFVTHDAFDPTYPGPGAIAAVGARTIANPIELNNNFGVTGSGTLVLTGPIDLGGTRTHTISNSADTEYRGKLVNGGFTKAGNGRLILSNYNNYNGVTTVSAGELLVHGVKPLGDPVSSTIVSNGATLRLGENFEFDPEFGVLVANPARMVEPVIINGAGVGGIGALRGSAHSTAVGTLTLASASTVHVEPMNTLAVLTLADFNSTLTLNGGGNLAVDRVRGGNVIINASTLTIRPCNLVTNPRTNAASSITALNITGGGALNLNNNAMVINYAGATPLTATSALLASGYNSGAWNGPGIRSQSAADTPNTAIGIAEAFETNYVGTFFGQPIDTTSLLLVYTRAGDANLDRIVNIADFAVLAANFNLSSTWARGDFNYDGMTNISDFAILAANFNQSAPPDLLRSSVPEPLGALLLTAAAALRRRRRDFEMRISNCE